MSKIIEIPDENLWESICRENRYPYLPPSQDDVIREQFNPALHHPVFGGYLISKVETYEDAAENFDPSISHPACVGYAILKIPKRKAKPEPVPIPDPKTCEPKEYLDHFIFPLLVPALTETLKQAKLENCFEKKKTKFNCSDFMTEYLYKNNPNYKDRQNITLRDIPFVKEWLKNNARAPLAKSLIWSESEAAVVIQSFWRGYRVRCQDSIQELRRWQWDWKEENKGIRNRVNEFWSKKMPDYEEL
ncbi:IQ domain-containing protein K-like [Argonauta hians]